MIEIETRPAVAPETTTPIKPSEAMRLGRMLYPRCEGQLAMPTPDGGIAVCALGAMRVGYGWTPDIASEENLWWPEGAPNPAGIQCPEETGWECGPHSRSATEAVTHLNDKHHWSTERIADLLEGIGL